MLKTASNSAAASKHHHGRFNSFCVLIAILFCLFVSINYSLPLLFSGCSSASSSSSSAEKVQFGVKNNDNEMMGTLSARRRHLMCLNKFYTLHELHRSVGQSRPTRIPPSVDEFEENGLPIHYYWFVDRNYLSLLESGNQMKRVTESSLNECQNLILNNSINYNPYNDVYLEKMLKKHLTSEGTHRTTAGVLGNYEHEYAPWIEALLHLVNPNLNIKVVDYQRKSYEKSAIEWQHTAQFFSQVISLASGKSKNSNEAKYQLFDVVVSHMSIEQIGLGRFGEKITPSADLDTLNAINCVLKPQGLLFLTLSASKQPAKDDKDSASRKTKSYVEFNVRRVYGDDRIESFLLGSDRQWTLLDKHFFNFGSDILLVLRRNRSEPSFS